MNATTISGLPEVDLVPLQEEIVVVSGTLQDQIDAIEIPTDFYSTEEVDTISGTIVAQIPTEYVVPIELTTTSGVLQDQIDGIEIPDLEPVYEEIATISGILQGQIDELPDPPTIFLDLEDAPSDYTLEANKLMKVSANEDGVEFASLTFDSDAKLSGATTVELTSSTSIFNISITPSDKAPHWKEALVVAYDVNNIGIFPNLKIYNAPPGLDDDGYLEISGQSISCFGQTMKISAVSTILFGNIDADGYPTGIYTQMFHGPIGENKFTIIHTSEYPVEITAVGGLTVNSTAVSLAGHTHDYSASNHNHEGTYAPAGDYALYSELTSTSGVLQDTIDNIVMPTDFYSRAEVDTISGSIVDQIPTDYISDSEMTTISGNIVSQIITDHGGLTGLLDNDHPQYDFSTASGILNSKIDTISGSLHAEISGIDLSQYAKIDGSTNITGQQTFENNVIVQGDLIVSGTQFIVEVEDVLIEDHLLTINYGEVASGISYPYAGIEVDRGTAENYLFVFDETEDNFQIGISGSLQPVATREASPTSNGFAYWNASEYRFDTSASYTPDTMATKEYVDTASGTLQDAIDNIVIPTDFYTQSEVDTISGAIVAQIPAPITDYISEAEMTTISGDITAQIPTDYATEAELTSVSGAIQDQIDNFSGMEEHDNTWHSEDYATESYVSTVSGALQDQIDNIPAGADGADGQDGVAGRLNPYLDTDHSYSSSAVASGTAGEALVFGNVCYFKSDGKYWKSNATTNSGTMPVRAMALESIDADADGNFLVGQGYVRDDSWTWTIGADIYAATTSGTMSQTAVSGTGNVHQILGYATASGIMMFNPSSTYIVRA